MDITWSHSRINKILENPAEYYLLYKQGISPIKEKSALSLGSAVHYGLELGTNDLTDYFREHGDFKQSDGYSDEQLLAESMCTAYFNKKNLIFQDLLTDLETHQQLELLEETHELSLNCTFKSRLFPDKEHKFLGIIDLLLLTEKGWILCDYKTSSKDVNWETYKSQLFKYILLLRENFPEVPLYKICIINIKKSMIRRKKNENDDSFRIRLRNEYIIDDTKLIDYHIYTAQEFSEENITEFYNNMSVMIDGAESIEQNKLFYINYSNIESMYGTSVYASIFYNTPDAELLYKIKDRVWSDEEEDFVNTRFCNKLDMQVLIYKDKILNHYKTFKEIIDTYGVDEGLNLIQKNYMFDEKLLELYQRTYIRELEIETSKQEE